MIFKGRNKQDSQKKKKKESLPILEQKAAFLALNKKRGYFYAWRMKRWYRKHHYKLWLRMKINKRIAFLVNLKLPGKALSTIRWVIVDLLRAKPHKFWGIYQFVALPGEGKTLSMVAHMERARKSLGKEHLYIATNFFYQNQDMAINHWSDIIVASKYASAHKMHCIIGIDEIHTTFDASDWKNFPPELLALLSFNRKYGMQFLCSSQIYDRIPRKVRDIANYTVICKNTLGLDRHFVNYYFSKANYDDKFTGKRRFCEFIRTYVAGDELYNLYDTLQQVDKMTANAMNEEDKQKQAFELLWGKARAEIESD